MINIKEFRQSKGWTQTKLAEFLGVTKSMISQVESGTVPTPELWEYKLKSELLSNVNDQLPNIPSDPNGKKIPYYEGQAFATISPAMADVVALRPDTFVHIPMFSQGEFALQVTGHSMRPYISHGDFVVVKRIINREAIIYDEPYMVVTKTDNLKTVKFVKEHKDKKRLWLVPYNIEQFNEQSIQKEDILEMYRVVGLFRTV